MVYNIEKMLKESSDKIQGPEKEEVEAALADARKTLEGTPSVTELKAAHDKLTQASHKLAEVLYKANASQPAGPAAGGPSDGGTAGAGSEHKKDEGVIDAEYVDVDDKK